LTISRQRCSKVQALSGYATHLKVTNAQSAMQNKNRKLDYNRKVYNAKALPKLHCAEGMMDFLDSAGRRWCPCGHDVLSTHPRGHTISYLVKDNRNICCSLFLIPTELSIL